MATLQTLDRGLQALTLIASAEAGLRIADLATRLDVDRAIAYRIVATLEARGMVARKPDGTLLLGLGVLALEERFLSHLRQRLRPHLTAMAEHAAATAFFSVAEGDQCVAVEVCEPETVLLRVGYQIGSRHPLNRGATGIAILSGRPQAQSDPDDVKEARRLGYSLTRGALTKGAMGVASPIHTAELGGRLIEACVGVVAMEDLDVPKAIDLVTACAVDVSGLLRGE